MFAIVTLGHSVYAELDSSKGGEPRTSIQGAVTFAEQSLLIVQREINGVANHISPGLVVATDDRQSYIAVRMSYKREAAIPPTERYVALVGPTGRERRVNLEKLVEYKMTRQLVFAAPKNELPEPVPILPLSEVVEGQELNYVGIRVNNDYEPKFERRERSVKVGEEKGTFLLCRKPAVAG